MESIEPKPTKKIENLSEGQLIKKRQALLRERSEFPPDDILDLIYHYQELILDIKIECERRRHDLRLSNMMSRKRITKTIDTVNSVEIETITTWFKWEDLDAVQLKAIDDKEKIVVDYYTNLIHQKRLEHDKR